MRYKAIMFDMDGTLIPMDMREFTEGYFVDLGKKLAPFKIEQKVLVDSIWAGTAAMVKNDGTCKNKEAFWRVFSKLTGTDPAEVDKYCEDFYSGEFVAAKRFTQDNPLAVRAVELAHAKADKVILATNPIFPMVGQRTRMAWVNLKESDFDLVTSYESDSFCKPNPAYFTAICERMGLKPEECLMIGNDENEDMYAGTLAGLDCFLVTDTMIPSKDHPWDGPKGTFEDLIEMLENL